MGAQNTTLLDDNPWLATLPTAARRVFIDAARVRRFAAGQRVHGKGEASGGLYGLLSGEVRVSASTFGGEAIVMTRLEPGEWFGEIGILDGGTRTHDSHAVVESTIAMVPKTALLALCETHVELYRALVLLLCTHCRLAFSAIDEFLVYSPEQRMARRLLLRFDGSGDATVRISQQELGALVGVSRQSANKILKRWEERGWIRRVYGGVRVVREAALRALGDAHP